MAICKKCGSEFKWTMVKGQWLPAQQDGSPHWIVCKAKQNRPVEFRAGPKITGQYYRPSCGECGLPPWEECGCSFESRLEQDQQQHIRDIVEGR